MLSYMTRLMCIILALFQAAGLFVFNAGEGCTVMTVNDNKVYQTFEGWGTSAAWWAQMIDDEDNARMLAEKLFNKEKGLGITVYRYNIGAGEADNPNTRIGDVTRRTQSFYVYDEASGSYVYDFTRDANARRMLDLALENGVEEVILFCNSPHFSMTQSGHGSGGLTPKANNLPEENYGAFADYLLTIADWFVAQGYPVTYISPINEPQWDWGGDWVGQEGCHYELDKAVKLYEVFARKMSERHSPYSLAGIESGCMASDDPAWLDDYFANDAVNACCDTYFGHGYWRDFQTDAKAEFSDYFTDNYPDKKLVMSEWCELPCTLDADSIESGIYTARIIAEDLTLLNPVSWQSWVAVNGTGTGANGEKISDGFFRANADYTELTANNRYFAFKQFSAFIEPGMKRIELKTLTLKRKDITGVAFTDGEKTVIVLVNNLSEDREMKLAEAYNQMKVFCTDASHGCEQVYSGDYEASYTLPAKSITTFILT